MHLSSVLFALGESFVLSDPLVFRIMKLVRSFELKKTPSIIYPKPKEGNISKILYQKRILTFNANDKLCG